MRVIPTISLRYMYSFLISLWGSPHNLPRVYYILLSNLTMRVPPQSPSSICTLIQSDYDGPSTISLRYMYSYPIGLWGSPHNLPQVYVLLCNLTMMVPPQSPSGLCTLIQSDYEGPPHNLPQIYVLLSNLTMRVSPHNLPQVYVLLSNLTMMVPPQSPSGICTLI